jgi:CubicO group peptidase (beta-lactamase class C family)
VNQFPSGGVPRFDDVADLLRTVATDHAVPGVAAAAVVDGELAHVATHGWRDKEQRRPWLPETPSRWYSISKPLTAIAVGRLVEAGKLSWDRPLRSLLPDLRFEDPVATERATIADCLLHRAGMVASGWVWMGQSLSAEELMRRIPYVSCRPGFRGGHHYQNLNFTILGEIFKALGTDWHSAMKEWLGLLGVKPLTRLADFQAADRALGYGPNGLGPAQRTDDFDFEGTAGASAVCGSILELAQVGRMMALGGTVDGRAIVSPDTWKELTRPVLAMSDPSEKELRHPCVALAGARVVYRGEILLRWAGGFTGYTAHVVAMPERRAAACALVNRSASPTSDLLAFSMLDRAVGWPPSPWAERYLKGKREMRARGAQRLAERLARPAAPWPCAVEAACGVFANPLYGDLAVVPDAGGVRLEFRHISLPLIPRANGVFSADGSHADASEIMWDLEPVLESGHVKAWKFGPDDANHPERFDRKG